MRYAAETVIVKASSLDHARPYVGLEHIESGTGRLLVSDGVAEGETANLFAVGDVLFGKLRPYLAKVLQPNFDGRCTSEALVLRPRRVASSFLRHVCLSSPFLELVNSSTYGAQMPRASWDFIAKVEIPLPPPDEQRAIADFLDTKTAVIDVLIAKKERLIELLQEKRQAFITQAVTKGLDPNVSMKDSGIEWLGEIPAHWKVVRLRRIGTIGQGCAFAHSIQGQEDGELPWFKVKDMNRPGNEIEMLRADNYVDSSLALAIGAPVFPPGTVIFPRVGAALLTNKRRLLARPSIVDDNVYGFIPEKGRSRFLYFILLLVDMGRLCSPGLVPTVTFSAVKDLQTPLPPPVEQEQIESFLDAEARTFELRTAQIAQSATLLREYRQALITAAVTGKLDVSSHRMSDATISELEAGA